MPDWQDRRDFYLQQGRKDDQAHEDMLAGRILQGLGVRRSRDPLTLSRVEQAVLGVSRGSLPAWPRAQEIFIRLMAQNPMMPRWARLWVPQAALVKDRDEAIELLSVTEWDIQTARPLLFTRKRATDTCNVYTFWTQDELMRIKPAYMVLPFKGYPDRLLIQQEAVQFVEQFGPYYILVE
jgi:hypothetical protein